MGRPWDDRRHVDVAKALRGRLLRGSASVLSVARRQVSYVAVRRVNGVVVGYWAGPVRHVRGATKPVTLDRAYRAKGDSNMRAMLEGCDLGTMYRVERVS